MELEGVETYWKRQEKMEGTRRQPMFLMERWTLLWLLNIRRRERKYYSHSWPHLTFHSTFIFLSRTDTPLLIQEFVKVSSYSVVPLLRRLVSGLSFRRSGFAPKSVRMSFVVDRVALGQVFLWVLRFHLSISFHHGSPCSYITWGDEQ
jgi:hypothetical protein